MAKIKEYLLSNFTKTFITIFLPFFSIVSLVYFIKISMLTRQIQLDFFDVLRLYSYFLPSIIFYTLPISFVTSISLSLMKMSIDNELTVFYTFGVSSAKILKKYLLLASLFTLFLFVLSFLAMPTADQLYKSFKIERLSKAKLNIDTSSLGQKLYDYYIFVNSQDSKSLYDITIYNPTQEDKKIFLAKRGNIVNESVKNSYIELNDGFAYQYKKDKIEQVKFDTLRVYERDRQKSMSLKNIFDYWKQSLNDKKATSNIYRYAFLSLIPLITLYLIASFSMINPRYQANNSYLAIFAVGLLTYTYSIVLDRFGNIYLLLFGIFLFGISGLVIFQKKIQRVF